MALQKRVVEYKLWGMPLRKKIPGKYQGKMNVKQRKSVTKIPGKYQESTRNIPGKHDVTRVTRGHTRPGIIALSLCVSWYSPGIFLVFRHVTEGFH